jgi:hypothetical protein
MKIKSEILFTLVCLLTLAIPASAQTGMEEYFYHSGKIKVVIGVATIVMAGLIFYVWRLDNRITRMEKEQKGGKP